MRKKQDESSKGKVNKHTDPKTGQRLRLAYLGTEPSSCNEIEPRINQPPGSNSQHKYKKVRVALRKELRIRQQGSEEDVCSAAVVN